MEDFLPTGANGIARARQCEYQRSVSQPANTSRLYGRGADLVEGDLPEQLTKTVYRFVEEHQKWLEEELLPNAGGDFRLGPELYEQKLAFTLKTPNSVLPSSSISAAEMLVMSAKAGNLTGSANPIPSVCL